MAVVASHLSVCLDCGRRCACLACLLTPALVRRASSGPVALGAPVSFPEAVLPFVTPGACAPEITGRLRGARSGRPRTGLLVPAAGRCGGSGAQLVARCTRSGPRDGGVPGGSLRRRSWAACAAVVCRVWTRSLTHQVSGTARLSTGDLAGEPGLFSMDADTAPFRSEDAGSRTCVPVRAPISRVGRAGPPSAFWCASPVPVAGLGALFVCWAASGLGLPCFLVDAVFFFLFAFFPFVRPRRH